MASTRGYVNIKTFEQKLDGNKKIEGKEISVAFPLYSDVHKISGAHYQTFPSEKQHILQYMKKINVLNGLLQTKICGK